MRRYETIFIIDPDLSDEDRFALLERTKNLIPKQNGLLVVADEWGSKKLAYEIKKKATGYYVRLDYCGTGALVNEIERLFRIDDRILKYMTVLLEKDVDIEAVKEKIRKKTEENEAAQETETILDQNNLETVKKTGDVESTDEIKQIESNEKE